MGTWPQATVRQAVWEQNNGTLARLSTVSSFLAIRKGYQALEGLAYTARTPADLKATLTADELVGLIADAVNDVADALREAGVLAGVNLAVREGEVNAIRQAAAKPDMKSDFERAPKPPKSKS